VVQWKEPKAWEPEDLTQIPKCHYVPPQNFFKPFIKWDNSICFIELLSVLNKLMNVIAWYIKMYLIKLAQSSQHIWEKRLKVIK
jgi:hypothetical protein